MSNKARIASQRSDEKKSDVQSIYWRYWKAYGGFSALFTSHYFWLSFLVTLALFNIWTESEWWSIVLSVIPNLLGFSLGGFALWIAIGDDQFRKIIASKEPTETVSIYAGVNANFVHFILLQVLALISALVAQATNFSLPLDNWIVKNYYSTFRVLVFVSTFIGFWIFIYAIFSALAATMGLFRVTYMYEMYIELKVDTDVKNCCEKCRKSQEN